MGIDSSALAIKVCKRRGLKNAKQLPIEQLHRLRTGSFDSVVMMGNNFGLFGSRSKAPRLLEQLHRITSADGRIIAQSTDPHNTRERVHHLYQKRNVNRGRMPGQLRIRIRYGALIGRWFDYLLVSKKELKEIVRGTGWKAAKFLDSREVSARYIMVLTKV